MTSYDVKSGDVTTLAVKINSSQTTGIKFASMTVNGTTVAWATTEGGIVEVSEFVDGTLKREWIYFTGGSVDDNNDFTPSGVVRGVSRDTTNPASGGTGQSFNKGATVKLVTSHYLLNQKADIDRANTWSAAQTIADTVKWLFGASTNWIRGDGGDLKFKDDNNSEVTLSELTAAAGVDTKVRISNDDTTSGFLNGKLTGGDGISLTEGNGGGDETLDVDVDLDTDPGLEFNSGKLRVKIDPDSALTRTSAGIGGGLPTGTVLTWLTDTAPTGFLLCYGQAVSRTTYSSLFDVIGETFGSGDGSTTFNLPDTRGRVLAGTDDMGGSAANRLTSGNSHTATAIGATFGSEVHQLVTSEIPAHTHTIQKIANGTPNNQSISSGSTSGDADDGSSTWADQSNCRAGPTGGDGSHNNVQPTITVNYIIKT